MTRPLDELLATAGSPAPDPSPTQGSTRFTVIVRTQGNRPRSLHDALDSIAAQTHGDYDVIVTVHADNATADQVRAAIADQCERGDVRLLPVQGGGRSRPLNAALDVAGGDYICFLDDDDLVTPDWLAAFARGIETAPGTIIRAVTESQDWTTKGGHEPVRSTGPIGRPFPERFDFLAHMSANQTPICSIALPRQALDAFDMQFYEGLAVFEDWDLLMRLGMLTGVTSIPEATSLYRRLDHGNADTAEAVGVWHAAHALVIERLSARPLLLPAGDAQRVASAHFQPSAGSRWENDFNDAQAELDRVTRSPLRWASAFVRRASGAIRHRIAGRQP